MLKHAVINHTEHQVCTYFFSMLNYSFTIKQITVSANWFEKSAAVYLITITPFSPKLHNWRRWLITDTVEFMCFKKWKSASSGGKVHLHFWNTAALFAKWSAVVLLMITIYIIYETECNKHIKKYRGYYELKIKNCFLVKCQEIIESKGVMLVMLWGCI